MQYKPMVGYIAFDRYRSYPHIDMEDIVSEGMIGVLQAIRGIDFEKVKSVDAWVALCAKRKMINFVNHSQNRLTEALEDWNTGQEEIDYDLPIYVADLLKHLEKREQLVLRLRYFKGWQQKEIAKALGCSVPNVWYIEQQALKKLRTYTTSSLG